MRPAPSLSELVLRARAMAAPRTRCLLGLIGPTGAGNTTLAPDPGGATPDHAGFLIVR